MKGSDSLYYIHYDSSFIDEINGDAIFYNVSLQPDSLQQQLLLYDTTSTESVYNVRVDKVEVRGANIPDLLANTRVQARLIELTHPVIYIIGTGKKKEKSTVQYDTLAIYEKLLGKYKSIQADEILIHNGMLHFAGITGEPHTSLNEISVQLKDFRIDSTRDYNNIVSYFIKDVVAKVKEVNLRTPNHFIQFNGVEYNAPGKFISLEKFVEKDTAGNSVFDISNTVISGISTDSFILKQQLKADEFKTDGGLVSLYRNKSTNNPGQENIEMDNNSFDEALLNRIQIGNTRIVIFNRAAPGEAPLVITNARFSADGIQKLYSGTSLKQLIGNSNWVIAADGFSFLSKDKLYKYDFGAFELDKGAGRLKIAGIAIIPLLTEAQYVSRLKYQHDLYDIRFNQVEIAGLDTRKLIAEKSIFAQTVSLQPIIKVFNDRTVTPNPASKVGKYPHQQIQKIDFPFEVKLLKIINGSVFYKERGAISKKTGTVFFKNMNANVKNVTNIKSSIDRDNMLVLEADALFMGAAKLHTRWLLPLNTTTGSFTVTGTAGAFDARALNGIAVPLGMSNIKSGKVDELKFDIKGDDYKANGTTQLVYEDLKIELLKKDSNELVKKDLMSFITNAMVKNGNAHKDNLKPVEFSYQRDTTKSFFSLVWKSILEGAKNTIQKLK